MRLPAPLLLAALVTLSGCVYWTPRSHRPSTSATVLTSAPLQTWDITSCGAGALSAVLGHHGDPTTMDAWQAALPKTRGGVMSVDLVLAAREKGFDARIVTGDAGLVEAEIGAGRPVIAMLQVVQAPGAGYDFFHYIVLDGHDPDRRLFRAQFGDGRARWIPLDRIEQAWKATKHATIVIRRPDPLETALRAAVRLEEQGLADEAAAAYSELAASHPRSPLVWTNLGNTEMRRGRAPQAEEAFRRAIELDPSAADAINNLAWLLFEQGRLAEAEPLARRGVTVAAPDRWMRLDTLAHILAASGACDEARAAFREAVEGLPESHASERSRLESAAKNCGSRAAMAR